MKITELKKEVIQHNQRIRELYDNNEVLIASHRKIERAFIEILDALSLAYKLEWKNDDNFKDTPYRIAKSYLLERCEGINSENKCMKMLESASFPNKYDGFVIIDPITTYSLCPHHFENITYKVQIGYIAKGDKVVGLSKVARVIKLFSCQPMMQEDFTMGLKRIFETVLAPEAFGLIVMGQHNCMCARGVRTHDAWTTTSVVSGSALTDPSVKEEFLSLLRNRNKN